LIKITQINQPTPSCAIFTTEDDFPILQQIRNRCRIKKWLTRWDLSKAISSLSKMVKVPSYEEDGKMSSKPNTFNGLTY
jgi:hypothetical protein